MDDRLRHLAPAGYYLALRVGFAFPMEEVNALPSEWVAHYTRCQFMLQDPVIRWVYGGVGTCRWSDLGVDDPLKILAQAQTFGLRFGVVVSMVDAKAGGLRSFGSFARSDREFEDQEIGVLMALVKERHHALVPPDNLTRAELEALSMVREGLRLKQIAYDLGVTEGAIKQRLKNAKLKLDAQTSAQAAALAAKYGLI